MQRILEYILLFVIVVALQVFFFDNLQLSLYIRPFVYLAFLILLPMESKGYLLLLLGLLTGFTMDLFMGTPAVNTIATVFIAFCRPTLLRLFVGKEIIEEGGIPTVRKIGMGKFIRYSLAVILLHSILFFTLETMTTTGIAFTLLRIVASTLCTAIAVFFCQLLFVVQK